MDVSQAHLSPGLAISTTSNFSQTFNKKFVMWVCLWIHLWAWWHITGVTGLRNHERENHPCEIHCDLWKSSSCESEAPLNTDLDSSWTSRVVTLLLYRFIWHFPQACPSPLLTHLSLFTQPGCSLPLSQYLKTVSAPTGTSKSHGGDEAGSFIYSAEALVTLAYQAYKTTYRSNWHYLNETLLECLCSKKVHRPRRRLGAFSWVFF